MSSLVRNSVRGQDIVHANETGFLTQGRKFFVRPHGGSDGASGLSPQQALQTLTEALSRATADQNDVVYLMAESNTASLTTDYQTALLDWNKNGVHLIGVGPGGLIAQRARVAMISTFAAATGLFKLSASGCLIEGIHFFAGVASALPTGCFEVTGQRNVLRRCHIAGMGNSANDIAAAYSLKLNGSAENLYDECVIGVDTVTLGAAANSQILTAGGATREIFRNCKILTYTNHATNNVFLRVPASTIDRWIQFEDCQFLNPIDAGSTALTQAAVIAAGGSPAGSVLLVGPKTAIFGATDWNSTDSGNVTALNASVTNSSYGLAVDVTR